MTVAAKHQHPQPNDKELKKKKCKRLVLFPLSCVCKRLGKSPAPYYRDRKLEKRDREKMSKSMSNCFVLGCRRKKIDR